MMRHQKKRKSSEANPTLCKAWRRGTNSSCQEKLLANVLGGQMQRSLSQHTSEHKETFWSNDFLKVWILFFYKFPLFEFCLHAFVKSCVCMREHECKSLNPLLLMTWITE
jgi:hypothetical protein